LRQPSSDAAELAADEIDRRIDVALVAGLAFDRRGYRLGHGAGYFDRFLSGRPFAAVGLAFDEQMVDELPVEAHDVAMDVVVAPQGVGRRASDQSGPTPP
jgi:5-formyltetrahydrofolate cyclo-ligase